MTAPTITDAMVEAAWFTWARSAKAYPNADAATTEAYYRAAMRAALEAAERAAWRPIEEAPEDGSTIMVFRKDRGVFSAYYVEDDLYLSGQQSLTSYGYWLSTEGDDLTYEPPTHFRHLPPPPEGDGK